MTPSSSFDPTSEPIAHDVFLSSVYREIPQEGGNPTYLKLRRRIFEIGVQEGVSVWVAEQDRKDLNESTPWATNLKACIDVLVDCKLLIVVLAHRAGGLIDLDALGVAASRFFELELFHASRWKIPIIFYVMRGYEPEPELKNLISILKLRDQKNWFVLDENEIAHHVRSVFRSYKKATFPENWAIGDIHDRLSDGRSDRGIEREIKSDYLSFVGKLAPIDKSDFDIRRVDFFMSLAEKELDSGSYVDQLSYLWMAMRDLSIGNARDPMNSKKWAELAKRWCSAAAWLGIHGPIVTGVLAGLHTLNHLENENFFQSSNSSYGPLASEFYSMGLLCQTPQWQRLRFSGAVVLATRQATIEAHDPSGALAIRASAKLRLASLGRPWLVPSALSDYKKVLRIREKIGADVSSIGEAIVEEGFARFQVAYRVRWKHASALSDIREGMKLMESSIVPARVGFVVRAKRKFAMVLEQAGFIDESREQNQNAIMLAKKYGVLGQLRKIIDSET